MGSNATKQRYKFPDFDMSDHRDFLFKDKVYQVQDYTTTIAILSFELKALRQAFHFKLIERKAKFFYRKTAECFKRTKQEDIAAKCVLKGLGKISAKTFGIP